MRSLLNSGPRGYAVADTVAKATIVFLTAGLASFFLRGAFGGDATHDLDARARWRPRAAGAIDRAPSLAELPAEETQAPAENHVSHRRRTHGKRCDPAVSKRQCRFCDRVGRRQRCDSATKIRLRFLMAYTPRSAHGHGITAQRSIRRLSSATSRGGRNGLFHDTRQRAACDAAPNVLRLSA